VDLGQRPDGQRRRLLAGGAAPLLVRFHSVQLLMMHIISSLCQLCMCSAALQAQNARVCGCNMPLRECARTAVLRTLRLLSDVRHAFASESRRGSCIESRSLSSIAEHCVRFVVAPTPAGDRDGSRREPGCRGLSAHRQQCVVAAGRGAQEAAGRQPQRWDAQGEMRPVVGAALLCSQSGATCPDGATWPCTLT